MTVPNPITEEEWDILMDSDMENTDKITFVVKNDKRVEFVKKKTGRWLDGVEERTICSECGESWDSFVDSRELYYTGKLPKFCPHCGAKME